jgi:hypothetical protein
MNKRQFFCTMGIALVGAILYEFAPQICKFSVAWFFGWMASSAFNGLRTKEKT